MNKNIIIAILLIIIAGGIGFYGGMKYQQMQRPNSAFGSGQGRFGTRFGGGYSGMRPVVGQIIGSDASSITVKMMDGSTKIVVLSSQTSINKSASGTKDDLKTGETVAVFGSQNQDGSVTAQNIQINPQMRIRESITPMPTQQGSY